MKAFGVLLALAVGLAAPALADPGKPISARATGPTPPAADKPSDDAAAVIDEAAINDATTPEARRALLVRCSGPPPRRETAEARRKSLEAFAAEAAAPADISLDPNFK